MVDNDSVDNKNLFDNDSWEKCWAYSMNPDNTQELIVKYGWKNKSLNYFVYLTTKEDYIVCDLETCFLAPTTFPTQDSLLTFEPLFIILFGIFSKTKLGKYACKKTKKLYNKFPLDEWGETKN